MDITKNQYIDDDIWNLVHQLKMKDLNTEFDQRVLYGSELIQPSSGKNPVMRYCYCVKNNDYTTIKSDAHNQCERYYRGEIVINYASGFETEAEETTLAKHNRRFGRCFGDLVFCNRFFNKEFITKSQKHRVIRHYP